jgi:uncharacterized damage-inducible protein DinB
MESEKDRFIKHWESEHATTMKVLKAYPPDKISMKPAEKSRSAKELAWNFVGEELAFISGIVSGNFDFTNQPKAPDNYAEILSKLEKAHKENVAKVQKLSEAEWNGMIKFFSAPGKMADYRRADLFWMSMMDHVHHRGQFSVYLRIAGAKVPSIYGPTADEPWM